jgi:hypothetical protein
MSSSSHKSENELNLAISMSQHSSIVDMCLPLFPSLMDYIKLEATGDNHRRTFFKKKSFVLYDNIVVMI